jgi:predicted Zn-dependent protease with MMP-like domain
VKLSRAQFEKLVEEGLALVPAEFRRLIDNVEITIEDEPTAEVLDDLGVPEDETLFGLYEGTPLTERTGESATFPDRIIIYRRPLLDEFTDPATIRREVARTVIHEVAHHFGIADDRLTELGWD